MCVCRPVRRTLSVEEGCVVRWVCGSAACVCARQWDRKETTVIQWATRWDHLQRCLHLRCDVSNVSDVWQHRWCSWMLLPVVDVTRLRQICCHHLTCGRLLPWKWGCPKGDFAFAWLLFKASLISYFRHKTFMMPDDKISHQMLIFLLQVPFFGKRLHHTCPCLPNLACITVEEGRSKCLSPFKYPDYYLWRCRTYSYTLCYLHCNDL